MCTVHWPTIMATRTHSTKLPARTIMSREQDSHLAVMLYYRVERVLDPHWIQSEAQVQESRAPKALCESCLSRKPWSSKQGEPPFPQLIKAPPHTYVCSVLCVLGENMKLLLSLENCLCTSLCDLTQFLQQDALTPFSAWWVCPVGPLWFFTLEGPPQEPCLEGTSATQ